MARLLFVIPDVPYPLVSGGHYRDWQILNILSQVAGKADVLYFGAGEHYELLVDSPVHRLAASVTYGGPRSENPDPSKVAKIKRKLGYLTGAGEMTFPFSRQYDAIDAGRTILDTARRLGCEVIVLRSFWCHLAPSLRAAGFKVVANCPDYNTALAWEMVRSVRGLRKVATMVNFLAVRRQERRFLPECDEVWMPTKEEAAKAGELQIRKLVIMPNLLDVDAYPDLSRESDDGSSLLFVANFGYPPNANGVERLLREIFPAIRRQVTHAKLVLVGRGLSSELQSMVARSPGVEAAGFVQDLTAYYRRAAVVLLPVTEGAGMLFKTLEGMAFGRSSVGFFQSFRGLNDVAEMPARVVASSPDFVHEVISLLQNSARRSEIARHARMYAEEHISWNLGVRALGSSLLKP